MDTIIRTLSFPKVGGKFKFTLPSSRTIGDVQKKKDLPNVMYSLCSCTINKLGPSLSDTLEFGVGTVEKNYVSRKTYTITEAFRNYWIG